MQYLLLISNLLAFNPACHSVELLQTDAALTQALTLTVESTPATQAQTPSPSASRAPPLFPSTAPPPPQSQVTPPSPSSAYLGITHQRPDGNRLARGKGGAVPFVQPVDIPLFEQPRWLVGAPLDGGSVWVAVSQEGHAQAFQVRQGRVADIQVDPVRIPPGMPPGLRVEDDVPSLVVPPTAEASPLTPPTLFDPAGGKIAFIESSGDLIIWEEGQTTRIRVDALPDSRILADERGRLLLLTAPTDRYGHGVLGDASEAAGIALIETFPTPRVGTEVHLPSPQVIEGIAPIWADMTGDGEREIIVTVSDEDQGARIVVFGEAGQQLAAGPPIGRGFRWRHQLAVAPFASNGELELVAVLTPHIGGVAEFYRLTGARMEIVAQVPGFSSHTIGSRNLDMAAAGDFDGDDRIELLVPDQSHTHLAGIRRSSDSADVAWTVEVGGRVSTNLATVSFPDGTLAAGIGHEGRALRLWLP